MTTPAIEKMIADITTNDCQKLLNWVNRIRNINPIAEMNAPTKKIMDDA